jgi:hypothetical protein
MQEDIYEKLETDFCEITKPRKFVNVIELIRSNRGEN